MKVSFVLAVSLISLAIADNLLRDQEPTDNTLFYRTRNEYNTGRGNRNQRKRETEGDTCNEARNASVQSVYVGELCIQLFIENLDGSRGWTTDISETRWPLYYNPVFRAHTSEPEWLGNFQKVNEIRESPELKNDGKFKRVSASFLHFSDSPTEKAYLVMGLNAHEFVNSKAVKLLYSPTGNMKPISLCTFRLLSYLFMEADQKLLMPEDKLKEVVSVALIKWVEKDEIKDHALYKIILKTVTKKLVKAYFKLSSKGELSTLNSEPFVPSAEVMQDEDEFNLLEESALYNVRKVNKLSMGYQFTSKFAFPIYYEYNPETNTYKEYPMRTKTSFNAELETLADKIPYWTRYIKPTETWLGCPETTFCVGHPFDAVFFAGNQYYAIYGDFVYTLALTTNTLGVGIRLKSLFPTYSWYDVDSAFTLGAMVFLISHDTVSYMTDIGNKKLNMLDIKDVFPEINAYLGRPVSAVITLDKRKEAIENSDNIPPPSKLKAERLKTYQERHERAAQTTKDDTHSNMVYVYFSTEDGGNVYQYEMENKAPPNFTLIANKTYKEVNAALPFPVSLVFTADGKVVTMVNHFMIEQSSETFFTQTENVEKFTLINTYFGCNSENLENKLTKEFVQNYLKFAGPKPDVNVFSDPADTQVSTEPAESTSEGDGNQSNGTSFSKDSETVSSIQETHGSPSVNDDEDNYKVKGSGTRALIFTPSFIIQAVFITLLVQMFL